jgi:hypothetical protein
MELHVPVNGILRGVACDFFGQMKQGRRRPSAPMKGNFWNRC